MSTIVKTRGREQTFSVVSSREIYEFILGGSCGAPNRDVSFCLAADYQKRDGQMVMRGYCGLVSLCVSNLPGQEEVNRVMRLVCALPYTHLAWRDSDRRTVHIVCRAAWKGEDAPRDEAGALLLHENAYKLLRYTYSTQLMLSVDMRQPKLDERVPFSHDPEAYLNEGSSPVFVSALAPTVAPEYVAPPSSGFPCLPGMSELDSMSYVFHSCHAKALEQSRQKTQSAADRKEKLLCLLADYCHEAGLPMPYAMLRATWVCSWHDNPHLLERIFLNAYEAKLNSAVPFGAIKRSALLTLQTEGFLTLNYELRKNVLTGVPQYRERNGFGHDFEDLTEEAMNSMTLRALKVGLDTWDKDINRLVNSKGILRYDPLEDYLTNLPKWDGRDRVEALAGRVETGCPDFSHKLHVWLLSMVAHWLGKDRLHGNAIVPLLVGGQGCGKTTFASILLPPELRAYYNDKVDFRSESDIMSALSRFALINIDEFDSLKKSQQPILKYLLSKSEVKVRPAYGKVIEQRRRYASFIATTNLSRPLVDRTGSRRFICVQITPGTRIDTLTPVPYEQLYAQLLAEINQGKKYWFDEDETREIQECNAPFLRLDSITEMIDAVYLKPATEEQGEWMSLDEILHELQHHYPYLVISQNTHQVLGTLLREKGYTSKKTRACNVYLLTRIKQ